MDGGEKAHNSFVEYSAIQVVDNSLYLQLPQVVDLVSVAATVGHC